MLSRCPRGTQLRSASISEVTQLQGRNQGSLYLTLRKATRSALISLVLFIYGNEVITCCLLCKLKMATKYPDGESVHGNKGTDAESVQSFGFLSTFALMHE